VLSCEPRLLRSAVGNLLRNAIKFSREESTVTVRVHRFEGRLVIEVEDECGGIAPERVSELFDPFVQAGSDRSGFGLGLAIAKQAAEAHRGSLRVVNLPGKGCVFALDLPVVQV
jgi:signal transduction histidine kinase